MGGVTDGVYLLALVTALWGTGLALGMSFAPRLLFAPLGRGSLLARVGLVDVVVIPLLVWALVRLLGVDGDYAVGLLLVGVASAGPLGIKAAQLAGADVPVAVSLVVVLELVNLVAIPFWAAVLLPEGTSVSSLEVLRTLLLLVLLPLAAGLACRRVAPRQAGRLVLPLTTASNVALAVVVAIVLVRDSGAVATAAGEGVPLAAGLAVAAALALGWLAGGPSRPVRAAAALVTGVRANGPALAIAAASFAGRPDVRAGVVVFALFSVLVPLSTALALRRAPGDVPPAEPELSVPHA